MKNIQVGQQRKQDSNGNDFYAAYDAQKLFEKYSKEIGLEMVSFKELVYVPDYGKFKPVDELSENVTKLNISGTELRQRLYDGTEIPDWFSFPEVDQGNQLSQMLF